MTEHLLLDPTLESALREAGLHRAQDLLALGAAHEPRRFVGFVDLPIVGTVGRFHLKRYRYANWRQSRGLVGRGTLWGTPPELREFRMLVRLRGSGVPAARPVAACALQRGGRLVAHALLTEVLPGARDLATRSRTAGDPLALAGPARRGVARALGVVLARMHAAGLVHRDLHARNVLVTLVPGGGAQVHLLDCRRGGTLRRARERWRDLATLDRDLQGIWTRGERRAALASYLQPQEDARAAVRRIAALRALLPPPRRS